MLDKKIIDLVNAAADIIEEDYDDSGKETAGALRATLMENERLDVENNRLNERLQKLEFVEKFIRECSEHELRAAIALARGRHAATHRYYYYGGEANTIGGRHRKFTEIKDYLEIAMKFFWHGNIKSFTHWCERVEREHSKSAVYAELARMFHF